MTNHKRANARPATNGTGVQSELRGKPFTNDGTLLLLAAQYLLHRYGLRSRLARLVAELAFPEARS